MPRPSPAFPLAFLAGCAPGAPALRPPGDGAGGAKVDATPAATLTGEAFGSYFGYAASDAGDVDGDGYGDVIVGAYLYSSGTGRAYLYRGGPGGVSEPAHASLDGEAVYNGFGWAVSAAGDVNGDGYDDVIIGAYAYSSYTGRAYVHHGGAGGLSPIADATLTGTLGSYFAYAVAGAGDVNGDGYDDVVVGAYSEIGTTGRAYVYHGGPGGLDATADATLAGEAPAAYFGFSLAGAGDVNGDGYDDVVVGAPGHGSFAGRAYVYHGGSGGLGASPALSVTGAAGDGRLGVSVSGAGDVDGDGYADVIVGADGTGYTTGRAYLHPGGPGGLSVAPAATLTEAATYTYFGWSVSGAGDVDNDGYDDVIVGAHAYSGSTGQAYVYPGGPGGLSLTPDSTLTGEAPSSAFGHSVSAAGDVNGDGFADVIVGADGYSTSTGRAYVYTGYAEAAADEDGDTYDADADCDDTDPGINPDAEDIPGDGIDQDCDGVDAEPGDTGEPDSGGDSGDSGGEPDSGEPDSGSEGDSGGAEDSGASPGADPDDDEAGEKGGCGACASAPGRAPGWPALLLLALAWRSRRARGGSRPRAGREVR